VVSAVVLGAFAARLGADVVLAAYAVFGLSMVAISAVDLERYIIPNYIVYPTLALLIPLLVVASAVDHRWGSLGRAAACGAIAFAGFFVLHVAVPKGMGFGDVRLAGVIGLAIGWLGFGHAFVGFFAGFVLGAVIGIVFIVVSGGGRKTKIPFGPFLAAGAAFSVVWGTPVANALFHRGT
jgi:leader peptidase (prepilin peptidase)/N-methyltransferase